jgi:exodeoxyribonuclease VII large subunit
LDEVANQVAHTPSLVISNIASTIIQNAQNAEQNWQMVIRLTEKILHSAKAENQRLNAQIREQSVKLLAEQRQKVASLLQQIKSCSQTQLNQAGHQIKLFMEQVLLGDPKTILNRGYAIIRNSQNQVISNKAAALEEKSLVIEFKDGRVTVMNNEK